MDSVTVYNSCRLRISYSRSQHLRLGKKDLAGPLQYAPFPRSRCFYINSVPRRRRRYLSPLSFWPRFDHAWRWMEVTLSLLPSPLYQSLSLSLSLSLYLRPPLEEILLIEFLFASHPHSAPYVCCMQNSTKPSSEDKNSR